MCYRLLFQTALAVADVYCSPAVFRASGKFVGDPLWTWVQSFMWGRTGRDHGVQLEEGPAPIPDAEQVRLLSFAAVNRGVRGLLYFSHRELVRLPSVASMVALTCREIRLFSEYLAAGTPTYHLQSSHPNIDASAFSYHGSVMLSAALFKPTYHRWVDEGVVDDVMSLSAQNQPPRGASKPAT